MYNIYYVVYPDTHNHAYLRKIDECQIPLVYEYREDLKFRDGAFMYCPILKKQVDWEQEPRIVVDKGEPFSDQEADQLERFFDHMFDEHPSYPLKDHELFKEFYINPAKPLKVPDDPYEYTMSTCEYKARVIYSIKRPNTPEPFTIIAPEPLALFLYLYRDPDWGLIANDQKFMDHVWERFKEEGKVEGEMTTELLEETEKKWRTTYVPIEVHRKSISAVKTMIDRELEVKVLDDEPNKRIK